jgi:hypothetical protein
LFFVPRFDGVGARGKLLRSKVPCLPVTAKKGSLNTAMYPCIQGCKLHFTGIAISSRANDSSMLDPGGSTLFHSRLLAGLGGRSCVVGSSFTTCNGWFARTARTCGLYIQPFCSTIAGWVGRSNVRSPNPSKTKMITFCRSPCASVITSCAKNGEGCCLAQLGSAAKLTTLGFGTTASNRTVPFTLGRSVAAVLGGAPVALARRVATTHIPNERHSEGVSANSVSNFFPA